MHNDKWHLKSEWSCPMIGEAVPWLFHRNGDSLDTQINPWLICTSIELTIEYVVARLEDHRGSRMIFNALTLLLHKNSPTQAYAQHLYKQFKTTTVMIQIVFIQLSSCQCMSRGCAFWCWHVLVYASGACSAKYGSNTAGMHIPSYMSISTHVWLLNQTSVAVYLY